jgi:hypothetical protein
MISRARAWAYVCPGKAAGASELIGNPRSSQQLMGQLPICCRSKAKKFNDFSRAGVGVCVSGKGGRRFGHHAVRCTELAPTRFKSLFRD